MESQTISTPASFTSAKGSPICVESAGGIVLGGDYLGLGIVRSLGRYGVPVCVIDDEQSISRFSRYTTYFELAPDLRTERNAVDSLIAIGKKLSLKGWVLYATRDELVAALSRYSEALSPHFRVATADWSAICHAWDKRNTYRLAEELGIPTPRTWYPRTIEELSLIDGRPPFAIKPAIKEHFFYKNGVKAWRADSHEQLRELFKRAAAQVEAGEIMIQDLIPGGGEQQFAFCAFFAEGRSFGSMVVRRSRQHPRQFGKASTYVETIDVPILQELSERFLRQIDYYGLVELEYKLDPRDNQFKLLDVNARAWGYHTLGGVAGVDFPYLLFCDQTGNAVRLCKGRTGARWIRLVTDVPTGLMGMWSRQQAAWSYLKSLVSFDVESVFCLDDPLPGIAELGLMPYSHLRRALTR